MPSPFTTAVNPWVASGACASRAFARTRQNTTIVSTPVFIEEQMKSRYAMGHGSRIEAMQAMGIREWVAATTRKTRLPADSEPGLFNWYVDEFAKGDPDVQVAMSKLVNSANASALLGDVKAPVLGLYPNAGQITSEQQIGLLEEQLSNFRLLRLPTDYHMFFPEQCTVDGTLNNTTAPNGLRATFWWALRPNG